MRARGSLDLLGPSTKQALAALAAGADVTEAGRHGVTNGAAMRVAPVGIATSSRDPRLLEDRVVAASRLTHNTGVALAGAAAVAAAVSAGSDGDPLPVAIGRAVSAAASAGHRGHWVAAADVAARITWATGLVAGLPSEQVIDTVYRLVGTSLAAQESVPAAFAVAAAIPDPWLACRTAASLGGDCDTIAAMAGAIRGASHGAGAFPAAARQTVARVNGLDFGPLAGDLLAIRGAGHG
jgi:ADP-ribosylglycohydrolase